MKHLLLLIGLLTFGFALSTGHPLVALASLADDGLAVLVWVIAGSWRGRV